eukprot:54466-Eustigmatos_ZCMA.PRE.1
MSGRMRRQEGAAMIVARPQCYSRPSAMGFEHHCRRHGHCDHGASTSTDGLIAASTSSAPALHTVHTRRGIRLPHLCLSDVGNRRITRRSNHMGTDTSTVGHPPSQEHHLVSTTVVIDAPQSTPTELHPTMLCKYMSPMASVIMRAPAPLTDTDLDISSNNSMF